MKIALLTHFVLATEFAQEAQQGSPFTQMLFFMSFIFLLYYFLAFAPLQCCCLI